MNKFEQKLKKAVPNSFEKLDQIADTSGVYAAWHKNDSECLYIGKAKHLRNRIKSHFSGQRGGDQFCLYVYDYYFRQCKRIKSSINFFLLTKFLHFINNVSKIYLIKVYCIGRMEF